MERDRLKMIIDMLAQNPADSFLNYAAALEYRKNGNDEKAIQLFEGLVENHPGYLGTYYQLGKMYENIGRTDDAIAIYIKGKKVATEQSDQKTLGEIGEALMLLDWDEFD